MELKQHLISAFRSGSYDAPMPTSRARQFKVAAEGFNQVGFDFINIDLDTAITFAEMGLSARDRQKRERHRDNARKAHDTVVHLIGRINLDASEAATIREKIERLEMRLRALEEAL